jgi:predicted ester cyclase
MKPKLLRAVALIAASLVSHSVIQAQTLSDNKKIILRSESELWSKGDLAVADQLYSTDFVCHFVLGPEWKGLPGIKNAVSSHRTSFPDWKEKVEDIIAEGDRVAIRISSSGTQLGEFAGIAPTGRKVTIEEFHIYRIAGGKIVEQWGMPDVQGLMNQLVSPGTDKSPK